ncbi:hypothetical protein EJB05_15657, partial [Eragrostis curvula]
MGPSPSLLMKYISRVPESFTLGKMFYSREMIRAGKKNLAESGPHLSRPPRCHALLPNRKTHAPPQLQRRRRRRPSRPAPVPFFQICSLSCSAAAAASLHAPPPLPPPPLAPPPFPPRAGALLPNLQPQLQRRRRRLPPRAAAARATAPRAAALPAPRRCPPAALARRGSRRRPCTPRPSPTSASPPRPLVAAARLRTRRRRGRGPLRRPGIASPTSTPPPVPPPSPSPPGASFPASLPDTGDPGLHAGEDQDAAATTPPPAAASFPGSASPTSTPARAASLPVPARRLPPRHRWRPAQLPEGLEVADTFDHYAAVNDVEDREGRKFNNLMDRDFYRIEEGYEALARQVARTACHKLVKDMMYEARNQAIIDLNTAMDVQVKRKEAVKIFPTKEQYLAAIPWWMAAHNDCWDALVDKCRCLGQRVRMLGLGLCLCKTWIYRRQFGIFSHQHPHPLIHDFCFVK